LRSKVQTQGHLSEWTLKQQQPQVPYGLLSTNRALQDDSPWGMRGKGVGAADWPVVLLGLRSGWASATAAPFKNGAPRPWLQRPEHLRFQARPRRDKPLARLEFRPESDSKHHR
jgi:hypothetical protein